MKNEYLDSILHALLSAKVPNQNRLKKIKNRLADKYKKPNITNASLLAYYLEQVKKKKITPRPEIARLLRKRAIRTMSGVAPIAVLTKHYPCPGKCAFCPTEKQMPKSYLSNEPAVMRAIRLKFDPFAQVKTRIFALTKNGHATDKIELIVMGGTFNYFPRQYQTWFIKRCFDACNIRIAKDLEQAQKWNETAKHRIIGLTLETRPDYINEKELLNFRRLGCTRIEIGVQAIDNKILTLNHRGSTNEQTIKATKLMKQAGFKVTYHMMPNLPGATPTKDLKMFHDLFNLSDYQPDMLKIYPTVVTKDSKLYSWWKQNKYRPYSDKQLIDLLLKMKLQIPDYVRIIRLIRDIPKESIQAGNQMTNLRQVLQQKLSEQNQWCKCIRCREARGNISGADKARFYLEKYPASDGLEYFLSYRSSNKKILYAFLRLRINDPANVYIPELKNCAIIREVHTYGQMVGIDQSNNQAIQHLGFGKKLVAKAEELARQHGLEKIAVISGIGVRAYYRKLGYRLVGTYMVKKLSQEK